MSLTLLAIGATTASYLVTVPSTPGPSATSRVTTTLFALTAYGGAVDGRSISVDVGDQPAEGPRCVGRAAPLSAVVGLVGVAADDHVDLGSSVSAIGDRARDAVARASLSRSPSGASGSRPRGSARRSAARPWPAAGSGTSALTVSRPRRGNVGPTPSARDDRRRPFERDADEGDLHAAELLDPVGREHGLVRRRVADVRREELEAAHRRSRRRPGSRRPDGSRRSAGA